MYKWPFIIGHTTNPNSTTLFPGSAQQHPKTVLSKQICSLCKSFAEGVGQAAVFCWPSKLPHVTLQLHSRWATTGSNLLERSSNLLWHHRPGWAPGFLLRLGDEVGPRKILKTGDTRESGSLKINARKKKYLAKIVKIDLFRALEIHEKFTAIWGAMHSGKEEKDLEGAWVL